MSLPITYRIVLGARQTQAAVETGEVDARHVLLVCVGRVACTFATKVLSEVRDKASTNINKRLLRAQSLRSFRAMAMLDVPTSERQDLQQEIRNYSRGDIFGMSTLWNGVHSTLNIVSTSVQLGAQSFILWNVVKRQAKGAAILAAVPFVSQVVSVFRMFGWTSAQTGKSPRRYHNNHLTHNCTVCSMGNVDPE